ncbi:MAG: sugar ABC transporter substrate-binding protein, partial [Oscillospiraceae bacterium]
KSALAMILCASLLASCSAKPSSSTVKTDAVSSSKAEATASDGEVLNVWLPPLSSNQDDKAVWDGIMDSFEKEHNVTVNVEIVPWGNYEEKYLTGITSGKGPDVGYMYMEMITDFIDMGALEPFDEYLDQKAKDNFLYLKNGLIRGKQYCLPIVVGNAVVMCYNKDILAANGITEIPVTWDDFIATCKKIKTDTNGDGKDDIYRLLQKWGNPAISALNTSFYPYLWQSNGQLFNDEGTALTIDTPAGKSALQFLYDLRFTHNILPEITTSLTEDDCINYFAEGKSAFVEMETTNTKVFDESGVNYGFITSLSNENMGTFIASDALVMLSNSKNKELAYQLILHMLSESSMTTYHKSAQFPPIAKDEEYHDNPKFKDVYGKDIAALHSLQAVKGSSKIYDMLYKNIQLMMIGELTPEQVISETTKYSTTVLSE